MPKRKRPTRTAIMVRTHAPSHAMLERIREWSASAAKAGCQFVVSIDVTQPPGKVAAAALEKTLMVHTYSSQTLSQAYPVLEAECVARVHVASRGMWTHWGNKPQPGQPRHPASLAWGFHTECINLWAQQNETFDHVWVLEDDVGCTGSLIELVMAYADDSDDLITPPSTPVFRSGGQGRTLRSKWCWAHTGSDAFLARVPTASRIKAAEHVQRFSRRLLNCLHELSTTREGAVAAWSEMGTPTLCNFLGLRSTALQRAHIGHTFSFDGRVRQDKWAQLCADESGPQLFHALKW